MYREINIKYIMNEVSDVNVVRIDPIIKPLQLIKQLGVIDETHSFISKSRETIKNILDGKDKRLLVISGPCSIHDKDMAIEYGKFIKEQQKKYQDELFIVMRVYFQKARSSNKWQGLIYDPDLNGTCKINKGLRVSREILLELSKLKVPIGTEFLDTIIPQYITDLISWGQLGPKTVESHVHRQLASGLSMPIAFSNSTDGNVDVSMNSMYSASLPHIFPGTNTDGFISTVETKGNKYCHLLLRGGSIGVSSSDFTEMTYLRKKKHHPNYYPETIKEYTKLLKNRSLMNSIIVDCSHGNSKMTYTEQINVAKSICKQFKDGNTSIKGVMIESNLKDGNQELKNRKDLIYGVSITDGCLGMKGTIEVFDVFRDGVKDRK